MKIDLDHDDHVDDHHHVHHHYDDDDLNKKNLAEHPTTVSYPVGFDCGDIHRTNLRKD